MSVEVGFFLHLEAVFLFGIFQAFSHSLSNLCLITPRLNLQQMEWFDKKFNPSFGRWIPKPYHGIEKLDE